MYLEYVLIRHMGKSCNLNSMHAVPHYFMKQLFYSFFKKIPYSLE